MGDIGKPLGFIVGLMVGFVISNWFIFPRLLGYTLIEVLRLL